MRLAPSPPFPPPSRKKQTAVFKTFGQVTAPKAESSERLNIHLRVFSKQKIVLKPKKQKENGVIWSKKLIMADTVWVKANKRSEVWNYFWIKKEGGKQVKCKSCPAILEFSSSTTNMWRHVEKIHHLNTSSKHPPANKEMPSHSSAKSPVSPRPSDATTTQSSSKLTEGPQLLQISIESSFAGHRLEPLKKVLARLAAKDRLSFRVIAESEDIRDEFIFSIFFITGNADYYKSTVSVSES